MDMTKPDQQDNPIQQSGQRPDGADAGSDVVDLIGTLEQQLAQLKRSQTAEREERSRLEALSREIEGRRASLDAQEQSLAERQEELAARAGEIESRLGEVAEREAAVASRDDSVGARESTLSERESAIEQRDQEAAQREERLEKQARELQARRTEIASEAEQLRLEREAVASERSRLAQRAAELESAEQAQQESHSDAEGLRAELDQARAQLAEATHAVASIEQDAAKAREEAEQRQSEIESLRQELETARSSAGASDEQTEALRQQIEKRNEAIQTLKKRLDDAQAARAELEDRLEEARSSGGANTLPNGVDASLRLMRLRRYRTLLQEESQKVRRAKDALAERQQECERILQQRMTLSKSKEELEALRRKLQAKAARRRGAGVVVWLALTIMAMGVMSWAVADRVVPATYLASATIAADASGRELTPEQRQAWRQYCLDLTTDPRLMEVAAERMRRRGLVDLASAPDLSDRLASDLDTETTEPGAITLTLRGVGADRTERVLDTYLASLVSVANDAKSRRLDQASTVVAEAPEVEGRPVDDPRPLYAGIGWGASSLLLILAALVVWIRAGRTAGGDDHAADSAATA